MMDQYRSGLDEGKPQARAALGLIGNKYTVDWSEYLSADWSEPVRTAVDMSRLRALGKAITTLPGGLEAASAGARHHAGARAHGVAASSRSTGAARRISPTRACSRKATPCD